MKKGESDEPDDKMSNAQRGKLFGMAKDAGIDVTTGPGKGVLQKLVKNSVGRDKVSDLRQADLDKVYAALDQLKAAIGAAGGGEAVG